MEIQETEENNMLNSVKLGINKTIDHICDPSVLYQCGMLSSYGGGCVDVIVCYFTDPFIYPLASSHTSQILL